MLETDENVNEETPDAPDQVAEEVVAPDEPAEEPTADEVAEEAPAEQPAAEEAPAEEAPAEEPAAEEAPAEDDAPEETLGPKERRRRARSAHTGEARPARTPEERAQERAERRSVKARQRRAYRLKQRERRSGQARDETPQAAVEASSQGTLKVRQGIVVSDKADKTITVRIDTARQHRMYKKIVRTSSVLHAHDERNEAHAGDTVRVIESRPLSRTKRWRLVEVLERAR
jgi:small subunit ribosomal protein S17